MQLRPVERSPRTATFRQFRHWIRIIPYSDIPYARNEQLERISTGIVEAQAKAVVAQAEIRTTAGQPRISWVIKGAKGSVSKAQGLPIAHDKGIALTRAFATGGAWW
jgi:hypothetical protein